MTTINGQCPSCKKPIEIIVGLKSTARVAKCESCGTKYDYSAWVIKRGEGCTFTKIELFPMREDRRMWTDEVQS